MMNKQCSGPAHNQPVSAVGGSAVGRCGGSIVLLFCRAAALPVFLLAAVPLVSHAQDRLRVTVTENFRQEGNPDGRLLGRVNPGTVVTAGETRDGWVAVTLDGWIFERSVRASPSADFDLAVRTPGGENLRESPNGRVVARLLEGFLLDEVGRRDGWVQVRRSGWMWGRSLTRAPDATVPAASPRPDRPAADEGRPARARVMVAGGTHLHGEPDGDTVAAVRQPVSGRVLARANGWAKVQTEAWVRESDLSAVADSVLVGVSAAEVRTEGATYEGRLVRWTLQLIAVQTADELRRDMPAGQRYLLARGPMPEAGFVYVMMSPAQATALEGLTPLTYLTVVGRVRTARSRYLGNPILELVDHEVAKP